ncbi:MAG: DUF1697 domain-containing protein [Bauldia sp.]|nr:DUF1697 domain-containing protein [Bauldia sp.]
MAGRYVALLRAISNVSMAPFRAALEELGYTGVTSFGMSGNLAFTANGGTVAEMERRIGAALNTVAIVRTVAELKRAAADNPFRDTGGSAVFFLARAPSAATRKAFLALDLNQEPLLRARTLYFRHPLTLQGKRAPLDIEKRLGVTGTARSSNVVERLAALGDG